MDEFPLSSLVIALAVLLVVSGFFSIAETAMMAVNRYRLKHRAQRGNKGAKLAMTLLAQTDRLLGVILFGNNLLNAGAATLAGVITARLIGTGELALAISTAVVTFLILVFSEITPKVVGATHADRIAPLVAYVLTPLLRGLTPVVWFVNLFVQALLDMLRIKQSPDGGSQLTQEELRSLVLEGSQYFRGKHKTMLANLMDLEAITVDDVMTPRNRIHALDLAEKPALLRQQLATSYHSRAAGIRGNARQPGRRAAAQGRGRAHAAGRPSSPPRGCGRSCARRTSFPAGTPLLTQLTQFQNDRQRLGLVVDEYGELQGLVTIEDIVEEIIGEFTTQAPGGAGNLPARARRQRRRFRHGAPPHAQSPARDPVSRSKARRRSTGSFSSISATFRTPASLRAGRTNGGNPANPGSRVKVVKLLPPVGRGELAFTNPGRAGIIDQLKFYAYGIAAIFVARRHKICFWHASCIAI